MNPEALVQDFFHNARSINFVSDIIGNIIIANKQALSTFADDAIQVSGKSLPEVLRPKVKGLIVKHIQSTLENEISHTSIFESEHLSAQQFKITSQVSSDKKHIFHSILEITDTEFEHTKALYQTMAEYSSDAITVFSNKKFAYISPAATKIFGFSPTEIIGEPDEKYYLRIHEDDATEYYKRIDESLAKQEQFQKYVYRFRTKGGKIKWIEDLVQRQFDKNGNETVSIINSRDVTDRKEVELALKESESKLKAANAAKDKFFSIIAHDLKSPFSALIGFSELLITQKDIPEDKKELFLNHIYRSAKTTLTLLENLLMWSRVQTDRITHKPVKFNLKDIVDQNSAIIFGSSKNKEIQLNNKITDDIIVFADEDMINTVLRNFLSNAVKFTPRGGKISISVKKMKSKFVKVSVTDTGVGISEENIIKVLQIDQSFTTHGTEKEKGSGLGLILCNEFVRLNGGRMTIKSKLNAGSTFAFTLRTA